MTKAIPCHISNKGKFYAAYKRGAEWKLALDARGWPILCDSEELALSVAFARCARIEWRPQ